jgi:hypothetical protein
VLQTIVMAAIFLPRMGLRLVRTTSPGLQILRGAMLVLSSVVFVVALRLHADRRGGEHRLPRAGDRRGRGRPLLGERVPARTWLALAAGFTGVLLIIRPGGERLHLVGVPAARLRVHVRRDTRSLPASWPATTTRSPPSSIPA